MRYRVINEAGTYEGDYEHLRTAKAHILAQELDGYIEDMETGKVKHFNREIDEREKKDIEYEITQTMLGYPSETGPDEEGWIDVEDLNL
jgi:hypothetical protein